MQVRLERIGQAAHVALRGVGREGVAFVGDDVTVGHGAVFESCEIRRGALIGMNAVLLHHCIIGEESLVAAGSVVPEGMEVPRRTRVAGAPARVRKELTGESAGWIARSPGHYVELSRAYLREGIGRPEWLRDAGIDVRHARPGVGANLQDHLQLRMAFKIRHALTLNTLLGSWWHKALMGCQYAWSRSGAMTMPPSQLGAFTRSDASQATPNIEYHVQPISLDKFGDPPHRFNAFTASACNLRPTSRGHVRITTADARAHPEISPNYLIQHQYSTQINIGAYGAYTLPEVNSRTITDLKVSLGCWYRLDDSFIITTGFSSAAWDVGFSYDANSSSLERSFQGASAYEFSLAYRINIVKQVKKFATPLI